MRGRAIASRRSRCGLPAALTTVSVFEPIVSALKPTSEPWDLAPWQRRNKRAFVGRAQAGAQRALRYSRRVTCIAEQ